MDTVEKIAAKAAKIEAAKAAKAAKADAAAKAVAEKAAAAEKAKPMGDAPTPVEAVKPVESTKPADAPKPVEVAPAAAPAPVSASAGSSRVSLRADDDCWVEIRDANGALVNSHLMHKGEVYTPPARPGLQLTVGNAGAISLLVDGKSSGALGRPGMVRRDVSLDPDRQSGSAE